MHNSLQIRALLIDDDSELLKTAKAILNLHGTYEIEFATLKKCIDDAVSNSRKPKTTQVEVN